MKGQLHRYIMVGIGSLISGIAINTFFVPHQLLSGGVSGIAMIFYFILSLPIGILTGIMNIPLFVAAYKFMDRSYVAVSLYGLILFSTAVDATRFLADMNIVDDIMLAAIYGGVINGIGAGLMYRVNGSSGGTDIIAGIMKKYYGLNIGSVGFAINCVIMVLAAFLFGIKPAMYTLLAMFVSANIADKVVEGFNRKKNILIITDRHNEIAQSIIEELGRGVTFLYGEGAFTRQNKRVLFVVITLTQIAKVKMIVERIDSQAFMIVQDAAEVLGKGFR